MSRVFVVEDDEMIREAIGMLLEMEGYEVHTAGNGQEAMDLLLRASDPPCLILLDLMMPVMDGVEFRQRQLQNPDIAHVPVVVVSGRADVGILSPLAIAKIIPKPFTAEAIIGVVQEHCAAL
jgi:CheY-like chemotaxis protein